MLLNMKAALLTGIKQFEIKTIDTPVPAKGEVLVKIKSVGICGSDVHYYNHGRIGNTIAKLPYVIGHECSGVVDKNGPSAKKFKPGDRVIIEPAIPCGKCRFCKSGKQNICPDVLFLGTPPKLGAYCEYMAMPEENLIKLPDSMSFDQGVMAEPLAIAVYATKISNLKKGMTVAIFGCGTIGLSILLAAKAAGAKKIFVSEPLDNKLQVAKQFGADYLINPAVTDPVKFIFNNTNKLGVDCSYEAAGNISAMAQAIEVCMPDGVAVISGIPIEDNIQFNAHTARRKGMTIKLLRRSNHTTGRAVNLIKSGIVDVKPIITHRIRLDEIDRGFKLLSDYSDNVIKVIINI
jgi:L-iditol 2-dehydrogenase